MKQTLAYCAAVVYRDFLRSTRAELQALGLSWGSLPFILYLGNHPGCTPTQLTQALGMDWGHSQRTLSRLADQGFLTREKSGRTHSLRLTDRGSQAFAVSHQVFGTWDDSHLDALSEEERQQLLTLMEKIAARCEANHHV